MSRRPTALVTGAAGGIGSEVSRRLIGRGYRILALEASGDLANGAAEALGAQAEAIVCDLTSRDDVAVVCERIRGDWRHELDIVVCNAGVIVPGEVAGIDPTVIDLHLDVMLRSAIHIITAAVPGFVANNRGHVLATVSMGGIVPMATSSFYTAAKAGLRGFLGALNAELRDTDVQVSGIYPSAVDTPMLHHEARSGGSPLNFLGSIHSVESVADAYEKALDTGKLELYVPYSDSLSGRAAGAMPWVLPKLLPVLNRVGERGRKKYLRESGD